MNTYKKFILTILVLVRITYLYSQNTSTNFEIIKIDAQPTKGFDYPYLIYKPKMVTNDSLTSKKLTLLIVPNNSGILNDTLEVHEKIARGQLLIWRKIADKLNTAVVMPIFPRTHTDSNVYTHALDRDVLTTKIRSYSRLDIQLLKIIKDAKSSLKQKSTVIESKIFLAGFSASGMFVNRFCLLHPTIVKAAAIGSPGGWPIAPASTFKQHVLNYPVGINDIEDLGIPINIKKARKIPMFIYMGDKDNNDAVVYEDGFDLADKDLIFELFGKTPLERWDVIKSIYKDQNFKNTTFKLYPNVKHTINNDMIADIVKFFESF
jgi:dienelactone hydrolase